MKFVIQPGKYVVAVSGGVDSMVLLDMLTRAPKVELIVAHYDHGIREDSYMDRELVERTAEKYGLPFEFEEGKLGPYASEQKARTARYAFLHNVKTKYTADAIITAHHQDDMIETALINVIRGTGRKGLTAIASNEDVIRPLLNLSKNQLGEYARLHGINWREDYTNTDEKYLRNYVRQNVVSKMSAAQRQKIIKVLQQTTRLNQTIDQEIAKLLQHHEGELPLKSFNALPHDVALEVMASWLRQHGIREFDSFTLERLVVAAKTLTPGKQIDISNNKSALRTKTTLRIQG